MKTISMTESIKKYALSLGFDLVRIASAEKLSAAGSFYEKWLKDGFGADMDYLKKDPEKRYSPKKILPGAKSIIMLGLNYFPLENSAIPFRIAKYAYGRDYHKVISAKLKKLGTFLTKLDPSSNAGNKSYVDFGPIMERAYGAKSQMGFIGKNALLITREFGSYIFLAEIITTLKLSPDEPTQWKGRCGTCTRCVDICPTKAIKPDRVVDSRLCISYLTIENRGPIPLELRPKIGNWLFGCDLCQDICPHNVRAKPTRVSDFQNISLGLKSTSLTQILSIRSDDEFKKLFAGTPLMRAKRSGLLRNACVVAGNLMREQSYTQPALAPATTIRTTLLPLLQILTHDHDPLIAEHAKWAITRDTPAPPRSSHTQIQA